MAHQLVKQQLLTKAEPHPGSNAPLPGAFRTVAMCVLSFEHGGDSASGPTLSMRAGDFVRIMRVEGGVADAWGAASVWWQGAVIHPGEGRSKHGTNLEEAPISTRQGWFPAHPRETLPEAKDGALVALLRRANEAIVRDVVRIKRVAVRRRDALAELLHRFALRRRGAQHLATVLVRTRAEDDALTLHATPPRKDVAEKRGVKVANVR